MLEMVANHVKSFYLESKTIPVVRFRGIKAADEPLPAPDQTSLTNQEAFHSRLLQVEEAMANFLNHNVIYSQKNM